MALPILMSLLLLPDPRTPFAQRVRLVESPGPAFNTRWIELIRKQTQLFLVYLGVFAIVDNLMHDAHTRESVCLLDRCYGWILRSFGALVVAMLRFSLKRPFLDSGFRRGQHYELRPEKT
ncbi:hypothetical protein M430DRAFT_171032 [Amorphotheca resinae ATCC 22711]|jgi:hypothetical protein|uniref:Uncharacterized protein n=1 Tax=Amorphotheca resinae ATCC 22711 TaxID=857342 RepID=A0A2T3AUW5_AMORE|nr:hypothetical protein M430DRAFT_171032 [Amorphotheca resinae ATCC 22711]PSS12432.1 hypothetical protein M430DRAFT_171032 [Amorphotheca resinae ATCC 22711]